MRKRRAYRKNGPWSKREQNKPYIREQPIQYNRMDYAQKLAMGAGLLKGKDHAQD